jgi:hypothetical protein
MPSLPASGDLTVLDWIGVFLTILVGLDLLAFPVIGARYQALYADFGSHGLPLLTRLAVSLWFPPMVGALVAAAIAVGLTRRFALRARRSLVAVAFVLGAICLALCWVGVYLPIFQLAGQIRSE